MRAKKAETKDGPAAPLPVKRILVPVDFSECSTFALRYATKLAQQVGGSIILAHVASLFISPPEMEFIQLDLKKFQAEVVRLATAKLVALAQKEVPRTLHASPIVRHGRPWEEITRLAKERKADLIVMGTHGYTGAKHIIMGSTAERVVRYAGCPVLVVREYGKE